MRLLEVRDVLWHIRLVFFHGHILLLCHPLWSANMERDGKTMLKMVWVSCRYSHATDDHQLSDVGVKASTEKLGPQTTAGASTNVRATQM
jgi:hypothetical protein